LRVAALAILAAMLNSPETHMYGLDLAKRAKVAPGSIYAILSRLLSAGILEREWEDIDPVAEGRPRRRLYRLTPRGEMVARREIDAQLAVLRPTTRPGGQLA
jgi:DNA-binding PadR family transcriptional regulator